MIASPMQPKMPQRHSFSAAQIEVQISHGRQRSLHMTR